MNNDDCKSNVDIIFIAIRLVHQKNKLSWGEVYKLSGKTKPTKNTILIVSTINITVTRGTIYHVM
jgi:hypothetical protein